MTEFTYDESSPSGLRWNIDDPRGRNYFIGMVAGHLSECDNTWRVKLDGKCLMAHRIIFELHYGKIEGGLVVDHIDGNSSNNLLPNLRLVTTAINVRNSALSSDNKTGVNGVMLNTKTNKQGIVYTYFVAQWTDGKIHNKHFSIKKLGYAEAFKQACEHREKMIVEMNARGAGYTERHGK